MKRDEYPKVCPFCESRNVDPFETENEDDVLLQSIECLDCHRQWRCEFEFKVWEAFD